MIAYDGFIRWSSCKVIFMDILPTLSCYSAMKLLYPLVPTVASIRVFELISDYQEAAAENRSKVPVAMDSAKWLMMLVFGFFVGFDTFLLKLRILSSSSTGFHSVLHCFAFLVQTIGIVELGPFTRKRLFLFIFGGEDGVMQDEEKELMDTWNAKLVRQMYRDLPGHRFYAVIMSFSDEDFQRLVFNEDAAVKRQSLGGYAPLELEGGEAGGKTTQLTGA